MRITSSFFVRTLDGTSATFAALAATGVVVFVVFVVFGAACFVLAAARGFVTAALVVDRVVVFFFVLVVFVAIFLFPAPQLVIVRVYIPNS